METYPALVARLFALRLRAEGTGQADLVVRVDDALAGLKNESVEAARIIASWEADRVRLEDAGRRLDAVVAGTERALALG